MAQINSAQFEALWEGTKTQPVTHPVFRMVETKPVQVDLSLSGILTQYMAMAARYRNKGRISQTDYDDLAAAVAALKAILVRINDSDLVAEEMSQNAGAMQRKTGDKTT